MDETIRTWDFPIYINRDVQTDGPCLVCFNCQEVLFTGRWKVLDGTDGINAWVLLTRIVGHMADHGFNV